MTMAHSLQMFRAVTLGAAIALSAAAAGAQSSSETQPSTPGVPPGPPSTPTTPHMRLVERAEGPLLLTPGFSETGLKTSDVLPKLAKLGPAFNKYGVAYLLDKAYRGVVTEGQALMRSTGQRGMLVGIEVLRQTNPVGETQLQLYGKGVRLVGVGPNAHAVAVSKLRVDSLVLPVPPGATFTENSQYVWLEPRGNAYAMQIYPRSLEMWARQVSADELFTIQTVGAAQAMDDYVKALQREAVAKPIHYQVETLTRQRNEAIDERRRIEKELSVALLAEERRASAMAGLTALSSVLSIASAIAMTNSTLGTDVKLLVNGGINSFDDLQAALKTWGDQLGRRIITLQSILTEVKTQQGTFESGLILLGYQTDMKPNNAPLNVPVKP